MFYFCSTIQEYVTMKYPIQVKEGSVVVGFLAEELPRLLPKKRVVVISDVNIDRHYHSLLAQYDHVLISQGETSKTLHTVDKIYRQFIELGVDRSTFVLGIGGGIVTDVAGFVASTYMRGLEFGFVSTTLLGQVDASVGGKNGVNVGGFKNMVGVFSQPKFVVCDVSLLHSLPEREFRAGLAEVIKTAILGDAELFQMLEGASFDELRNNDALLSDVIYRCMRVKASVVAEDEREGGRRRILNLGHTLAHAIEKSTRQLSHGEAVAVGLYWITRYAEREGMLSKEDSRRIVDLIEKYGFDVALSVERNHLFEAVRGDKKRSGDTLHLIVPTAIGTVEDILFKFEDIATIF